MADSSSEKTSMAAKNTSAATSDEAENIAESLSSLSITPSDNNPSSATNEDAEPENPGDVDFTNKKYDFALLLKPSRVLKHAMEALSDSTFNKPIETKSDPKFKKVQSALIQVTPQGCEFTVRNDDSEIGDRVVGCLRLCTDGLESFHCSNPFRKMVTLNGVARLLRDADNFNYECVVLFVEQGSNSLSFQWGNSNLDFALGHPVNIDLHDVKTDIDVFPTVNYAFGAVIPSEDLRALLTKLRNSYASESEIPAYVELYLRPGAVKMMVNDIASSTLEMYDEDSEVVWMDWKLFRGSLEKASHVTDECGVYLLTEPPESILLRFDLAQLGDMAYLSPAQIMGQTQVASQTESSETD